MRQPGPLRFAWIAMGILALVADSSLAADAPAGSAPAEEVVRSSS